MISPRDILRSALRRVTSAVARIDSTRVEPEFTAPLELIALPVPPDVPPTPVAPLLVLSPADHAVRFLEWLQDEAPVDARTVRAALGDDVSLPAGLTGEILARDLAEMHGEMCLDLGLEQARWAAVSKHFRQLVGDRKRYTWHRDLPDSEPQRLCVMTVPARIPWAELPVAEPMRHAA